MLDTAGGLDLHTVEGQTEHKIRIMEECVPADCAVTLVGHGVGCYMAAKILRHFESKKDGNESRRRITLCMMLFPTMTKVYYEDSKKGTKGSKICSSLGRMVKEHVKTFLKETLCCFFFSQALAPTLLLPRSAHRWLARRLLSPKQERTMYPLLDRTTKERYADADAEAAVWKSFLAGEVDLARTIGVATV